MDSNKLASIASKVGAQVTTDRNSTILNVPPDKLVESYKLLLEEMPEFYHLITITGLDEGNLISVYYHFWKDREFLSIKTGVPKENPTLDSISDLIPAALLYEVEVKDMLGVSFNRNPMNKQKLLLPDDYPVEAPPPLRKEASPEKLRKLMKLE